MTAIRTTEMHCPNAEPAGVVCHDPLSVVAHGTVSRAPRPRQGTGVGFSASKFFDQKFIMTKYSCQSHC
ncbi:hypothetical protein NK6_1589 [Bradyrhizobium diazoefficiens]|uniref:Uncharacterized protein n=1 Tax=Bradyrhizobium diazoefficiens TaxID=1355477 RepID=A0A0E4BLH6_9BRAD|nr:hypothetical protein NK6_1589 [Bradyrhizobium diazoefficiens]